MTVRNVCVHCGRGTRFLPNLSLFSQKSPLPFQCWSNKNAATVVLKIARSASSTTSSLDALLDRVENEDFDDDHEVISGSNQSTREQANNMTSPPFELPPPSWSLRDLNLGSNPKENEVELSQEQVKKICAIAHISLDPDGEGGFDAASATRDVGAMLRTMQSMRTGRDPRGNEEGDAGAEGPWGTAATWAAPLHEDVVSDGDMQMDIVGSAARKRDGFFTARRVVGGDDEAMP